MAVPLGSLEVLRYIRISRMFARRRDCGGWDPTHSNFPNIVEERSEDVEGAEPVHPCMVDGDK